MSKSTFYNSKNKNSKNVFIIFVFTLWLVVLLHDSGEGFAILLLKTSCIKTQVCLDDECQEAAAARNAGFASQASQF